MVGKASLGLSELFFQFQLKILFLNILLVGREFLNHLFIQAERAHALPPPLTRNACRSPVGASIFTGGFGPSIFLSKYWFERLKYTCGFGRPSDAHTDSHSYADKFSSFVNFPKYIIYYILSNVFLFLKKY